MVLPHQKKATYADIQRLPDALRGEILAGELYVAPRPSPIHQKAMTKMTVQLGGHLGGNEGDERGWIFLTEPELHLNDEVIVPDLAAWKAKRVTSQFYSQAWVSVTPDWICEIQSPSTARIDRITKRRIYLGLQIPYYWLVDPLAKTLEALKKNENHWIEVGFHGGDEKVRIEPFQDLEIELSTFWPPESPATGF